MIYAVIGLVLGLLVGFVVPWGIPAGYSSLFSVAKTDEFQIAIDSGHLMLQQFLFLHRIRI